MDLSEFNKNSDVKFQLEEGNNEFGESILTCEGTFPTVFDSLKLTIRISGPLKFELWEITKILEPERLKEILLERFIERAVEAVKEITRRQMS